MSAEGRRPSRCKRPPGEWWATGATSAGRPPSQLDENGLPLAPNEAHVFGRDGVQYIATIEQLGDQLYHVHFHGWAERWDERVSAEDLRGRAPGWAVREAKKRLSPLQRAGGGATGGSNNKRRETHQTPGSGRRTFTRVSTLPQRLSEALHTLRVASGAHATTLLSGAPTAVRHAAARLQPPTRQRSVLVAAAVELLSEAGPAVAAPALNRTEPDGAKRSLGSLLLVAAAQTGHATALRLLYESGGVSALTAVDQQGATAAHHAARAGQDDCLRVLAECGAIATLSSDTAANDATPAHWAAQVCGRATGYVTPPAPAADDLTRVCLSCAGRADQQSAPSALLWHLAPASADVRRCNTSAHRRPLRCRRRTRAAGVPTPPNPTPIPSPLPSPPLCSLGSNRRAADLPTRRWWAV